MYQYVHVDRSFADAMSSACSRKEGRGRADRLPPDFAFRLTTEDTIEAQRSRSHPVILKRGQNIKYLPLALTEHGAIMAATVLNTPRAVQMSIFVVRAFLRLREWVAGHADLSARLTDLERRVGAHDHELKTIIEAIREMVETRSDVSQRRIGFGERISTGGTRRP